MFYVKPDAVSAAYYLVKNGNGNHLVDDAGNHITVDVVDGIVYKTSRPVGASSVKRNGYKYCNVSIDTMRDGMTTVLIGCHVLVAMCSDIKHFMLSGCVPCHINNTPWDNRACNIEWGTAQENNIHGRIVACLQKEFPCIFTYVSRGHVILKKGIKNAWIREYLALTEANYFAVERGNGIDVRKLVNFVDWLEKKKYW